MGAFAKFFLSSSFPLGILFFLFTSALPAAADTLEGCQLACNNCVVRQGELPGGDKYVCADKPEIPLKQNPFGTVAPPPGVANLGTGPGGIITLLNIILKLLVAAGGIYALINIIIAGYGFISAGGDPKAITSAWAKIWQSLLGLTIIASSFLLAAIFGQLIFGTPYAILNPKIYTP